MVILFHDAQEWQNAKLFRIETPESRLFQYQQVKYYLRLIQFCLYKLKILAKSLPIGCQNWSLDQY